MTIKKGDTVYVIAGREKGKQGKIERVIVEKNRAVIAGVNIRKRHIKPSQKQPKGGIADFAAAFSAANMMILCPHCSKTTRVKMTVGADNKKFRTCIHCNGSLDTNV